MSKWRKMWKKAWSESGSPGFDPQCPFPGSTGTGVGDEAAPEPAPGLWAGVAEAFAFLVGPAWF